MIKSLTKQIIIIVFIVFFVILLFNGCSNFQAETIKYKDIDGGKALNRYTGSSKITEFTVPNDIDGVPVIELQKYSISSAEYLKKITIGKNVKIIDSWTISYCPNLEKIIVDPLNEYYETDDYGVLYNKGKTELIHYPTAREKYNKNEDGSGGKYIIPQSVTKIGEAAFYLSTNIVKVEFNEGLLEIGDYAFIKCENLGNFTFPSTLQKIGKDSFSFCDSLNILSIPKSVTYIGDYAFFSLYSSIKEINIYKPLANFDYVGSNWIPTIKDTGSKKASINIIE